jgi:hypothetical protein
MIRAVDALEPLRAVLHDGGYAVEPQDLPALGLALLAETEHALVLCITAVWDTVEEDLEEAQARLTRLAAIHPSPRSWDLYVVAVITDDRDDPRREMLEGDTRYARKLILVGVGQSTTRAERALLSLLPLRPTARFTATDPLAGVRDELLAQGVEADVADTALASFVSAGRVDVP